MSSVPIGESSPIQLLIDPARARVDTPPVLVVEGSPTGAQATLTVTTSDTGGHRWRSSTQCLVGRDGVLQLSDRERPWWNVEFTDRDVAAVSFQAPDSTLDYEIEVKVAGSTARATARRLGADRIAREDLAGQGWRMRLYRPRSGGEAGVVVIPGSTGAVAMAPLAALLASHGYVTGVLAYMQERGLPNAFRQIPLEAVEAGMRAFAAAAAIRHERIGPGRLGGDGGGALIAERTRAGCGRSGRDRPPLAWSGRRLARADRRPRFPRSPMTDENCHTSRSAATRGATRAALPVHRD